MLKLLNGATSTQCQYDFHTFLGSFLPVLTIEPPSLLIQPWLHARNVLHTVRPTISKVLACITSHACALRYAVRYPQSPKAW